MARTLWIILTLVLIAINGFFVAAEFALVKARRARLQRMADEGGLFAASALWLYERLDRSLSACQLGITMASLALGWVGEPAIARLVEPLMHAAGVQSPAVVHTVAFIIAFTIITAGHLVLGEQAPKIFAIRRPEALAVACAVPLRVFYVASFPFLVALSASTSWLLKLFGVGEAGHEHAHSEEEIRFLVSQAHAHGELTRSEQRLIDAVFEFDDTLARQIMVPRMDVVFLDVEQSGAEVLERISATRHTRYPVCAGSLDEVLGVLHVKDLVGRSASDIDAREIMRPPRYVPETLRISRLLGHFQATRQHLAFVVDEHGALSGIVTLENVLERIVGAVEDEFDLETPRIVPDGAGRYLVDGGAPLDLVNRSLGLALHSEEMDTIGGFVMEHLRRVPDAGDAVDAGEGVRIEVVDVRGARATRVRVVVPRAS